LLPLVVKLAEPRFCAAVFIVKRFQTLRSACHFGLAELLGNLRQMLLRFSDLGLY
jgi:hypothetical protein